MPRSYLLWSFAGDHGDDDGNDEATKRQETVRRRRRRWGRKLVEFIFAAIPIYRRRIHIYFIAIFIPFTKTSRRTASLNILRCDRPAPSTTPETTGMNETEMRARTQRPARGSFKTSRDNTEINASRLPTLVYQILARNLLTARTIRVR